MSKTLFVHDSEQLHKTELSERHPKLLTLGNDPQLSMYFKTMSRPMSIEWDGERCYVYDEQINTNGPLKYHEQSGLVFFLADPEKSAVFDISDRSTVSVGRYPFNEIQIEGIEADFLLERADGTHAFSLDVYEGHVFHNFKRVDKQITVNPGDQLFVDGVKLVIRGNDIEIFSSGKGLSTSLIELPVVVDQYSDEYPNYHRSPRIIHREPVDKITIAKPSTPPSKPSEQLARTIVPPHFPLIITNESIKLFNHTET